MPITQHTRRSIVEALVRKGGLHGRLELVPFLEQVWPLEEMPSTDPRFQDAAGDIWQHAVIGGEWDEAELYAGYLGLPSAPEDVFVRFLEQVTHPAVRRGDDQAETVALINRHLEADGLRLEAAGEHSGHPVYQVRTLAG